MAFKIFNIGKANEEVTRLESEVDRLTKELAAEKENSELIARAAECSKTTASNFEVQIKQAQSDLATAKQTIGTLTAERDSFKAIVESPEGEIEKRASAKATDLAAKMGVPPLPADKADLSNQSSGDIAAQFAAMKPGPERTAFFNKHKSKLT